MNLNMANRQCCDLDIRDYKTLEPFMFADFCNTTTAGFTSENVYAMRKGAKQIAFSNPMEGTMSLEFQVHPFKVYALLSDGVIETSAVIPARKTISCTEAGKLALAETIVKGSLFVYKAGEIGEAKIEGNVADESGTATFTATSAADIKIDEAYDVCYLVAKTNGVKKISFNNKKAPKDYRVTMETLDKDENGELVPCKLTAYKATPKKSIELSFSSTGDPASVKIDFDCMEDRDGNVMDIIEIVDAI